MRKKIVAGNWKMNTKLPEGKALANEIADSLPSLEEGTEVILFPPFTHLVNVKEELASSDIKIGAQNCHTHDKGAYTGEISAEMIQSIGMEYCLVGHSERRAYFFEDNSELLLKIKQLLANGIKPVFCCGEQLEDRKTESHFDVISAQCELLWELSKEEFAQLVIAYEPVWAIGTGETATAQQAQEIHAYIRGMIEKYQSRELANKTTILYGGSCKPTNSKELFSENDIDGGLIGGAALKAEDFIAIVNSL